MRRRAKISQRRTAKPTPATPSVWTLSEWMVASLQRWQWTLRSLLYLHTTPHLRRWDRVYSIFPLLEPGWAFTSRMTQCPSRTSFKDTLSLVETSYQVRSLNTLRTSCCEKAQASHVRGRMEKEIPGHPPAAQPAWRSPQSCGRMKPCWTFQP